MFKVIINKQKQLLTWG